MGKEMKNKLLAVAVSLAMVGCASNVPYVKVGAGYKFKEANVDWGDGSVNDPISARIELGIENGPWSYGYSHHSQWFTGPPLNNNDEYSKHEIFVDYTWRWE
jgi:hypothetical protein